MEMLWQSTASAIREVLAKSGVKPEEIAGIGNTGHGNGVYLLDKQGQPLRNGIQSMDSRAADIVDGLEPGQSPREGIPVHDPIFLAGTAERNACLAQEE